MVDDTITKMARAMPKLQFLVLGDSPCREVPIGVTAKGFAALTNHCSDLRTLCVHFQVATLSVPPVIDGMTSDFGPTALRRDCALIDLLVGRISVTEESVLAVAQTLVWISPHIRMFTTWADKNWEKVLDAICDSRKSGRLPG